MKKTTKKKFLVAVSGGPDSMALLDMHKDKYEIYACHINYHKRDSADRDENIVKDYCLKNNIPFIKYDFKDNKKGNFQDRARVFRYDVFAKCVRKYQLDGVLVGHHEDDLIETYFLQLDRKSEVSYWGLNKKSKILGVDVYRPLLKYTKDDLIKYVKKKNIEYGIDESNLSDDYKRNKIRHQKVEKMTKSQKTEIVKEINRKNKELKEINKEIKAFINNRDRFLIEEFNNFKYQKKLLRMLIDNSLSDKYLSEILKAISSKKNIELMIKDKYLFKEYGYIEVKKVPENYHIKLDKLEYGKYEYFSLAKKGTSLEGVSVKEDDFPLTIRNCVEGDYIKMRFGTKKISRFFIDRKISSYERKIWPVVLNSKNDVILLPGLGCDLEHYSLKHNLFVLK